MTYIAVREQLKELTKKYDKSENDLKALQSVGQVRIHRVTDSPCHANQSSVVHWSILHGGQKWLSTYKVIRSRDCFFTLSFDSFSSFSSHNYVMQINAI